jgi:hypothetical protein
MAAMGRRHDDDERYYDELNIDSWVAEIGTRVADGDPEAVEAALDFLERDPYFFRSGYARERLARRLAHTELTGAQKTRARAVVLTTVDGQRHCPLPGVGKLAGAFADNSLRRDLRERLHNRNTALARRALRIIVHVRHPGLSREDIEAARALVLTEAARGLWLSPTVARLARYLWSSEWEAELATLVPHHGPDRAGAKRLLEAAAQRKGQRPAP